MVKRDIDKTEVTDTQLDDYSIDSQTLDSPGDQKETKYNNANWNKQLGFYKTVPELKQSIDALAMWTAGRGWTAADIQDETTLNFISGWGEDTFSSIMMNMIRTKKIGGDAFAEIIREKGKIINIKVLNPGNINIVVNRAGIITRYEQITKHKRRSNRHIQPEDMLHLSNDRLGDEIHGISVIDSCETIILARNEAITDYKKVLHRNINPLKIFELDTSEQSSVTEFRQNYEAMTKDYEALIVPKGNASVTIPNVPLQNPLPIIQHYEDVFYRNVGVPKAILGGTQDFTEAASKVSYMTFEQVYKTEQTQLEKDIYKQTGLVVVFDEPVSMKEDVQTAEAANTGQVAIQPNEWEAPAV